MGKTTIINLTRFGDLLQTQPVIAGLQAKGDEVGLVCLDNFGEAAGLLLGLSSVSALPGGKIMAGLEREWRLCVNAVLDWVACEHGRFEPDRVLNFTAGLSARLLSRIMHPGGQAEGFSIDEHGFGMDSSAWTTYAQASTLHRGSSPFNLVDGFRKIAGVDDAQPIYALRRPSEVTSNLMREKLSGLAKEKALRPGPYIGFQLGASTEARQWPCENFVTVGHKLTEAGYVPVLLGSAGEKELAGRYFAHAGIGLDLTGQTDLYELSSALCLCDLLITNDTGTMHLAAGLGVHVLAVFLATAQPWDTGPYMEGSCCLEPRLGCHPCGFSEVCPTPGQCQKTITGESVFELALAWLKSGQWPLQANAGRESRIWLTTRDEYQFMDLQSLSGDESQDRTIWIRLQRLFYRHFLDALDLGAGKANAFAMEANDKFQYPLSHEFGTRVLTLLSEAESMLMLASEQLRLLTIRSADRAKLGLLATCAKIGLLFESSPDFKPLAHLWKMRLHDSTEDWRRLQEFFLTLHSHVDMLSKIIREIH